MNEEDVERLRLAASILQRIKLAREELGAALNEAEALGVPAGTIKRAIAALDGRDRAGESERLRAVRCAVCGRASVPGGSGADICLACQTRES